MKKITCIVLALLMLLPLAACGNKTEITIPSDVDLSGLGSLFGGEQGEAAATPDANTAPDTTPAEKDEPAPAEKEEPSASAASVYTMRDYVVWDDEYCRLTIVGFEEGGLFGGIKMEICMENKTEDKSLVFELGPFAACGYMMNSPQCYKTVDAGEKQQSTLEFSEEDMETCGVSALDEVKFTLEVNEEGNWLIDPLVMENFTVYPTGKTAEQIQYQPLKLTGGETVLYEDDKFRVVLLNKGEYDDYLGYILPCYIENLSDLDILVGLDNISVNGAEIISFFGDYVYAGNRSVYSFYFLMNQLEENGIKEVEEIQMTLRIQNGETKRILVEEPCTLWP